jgi:hypothetical protein
MDLMLGSGLGSGTRKMNDLSISSGHKLVEST